MGGWVKLKILWLTLVHERARVQPCICGDVLFRSKGSWLLGAYLIPECVGRVVGLGSESSSGGGSSGGVLKSGHLESNKQKVQIIIMDIRHAQNVCNVLISSCKKSYRFKHFDDFSWAGQMKKKTDVAPYLPWRAPWWPNRYFKRCKMLLLPFGSGWLWCIMYLRQSMEDMQKPHTRPWQQVAVP